MGWNSSRWTHQAVQPEHLDARADTDQGVAIVLAILSRSFAAWEQPELLSAELRAAFKSFDSSGHMTSRRLMTLQVVVPPPQRLGAVPHGTRVIAPITSGAFEGPRLRGRVLPGGGDWTLLRSDAVLELDLRITLETDDGALISMTSFGLRHGPPEVLAALARGESVDPSTYYFRTAPRFETSAPQYEFLNRLIAIASGDRRASGPIYTIDEVL